MEDEIEEITITTTLDTDDKQCNWIKIPAFYQKYIGNINGVNRITIDTLNSTTINNIITHLMLYSLVIQKIQPLKSSLFSLVFSLW